MLSNAPPPASDLRVPTKSGSFDHILFAAFFTKESLSGQPSNRQLSPPFKRRSPRKLFTHMTTSEETPPAFNNVC